MGYEPKLIAPFENSGLKKWYKPWITGATAFPQISDAYARRGVVRKREGFRLLAAFPGGDKPVQGLKTWINPSTLGENLIGFSLKKSYVFSDISQSYFDVTQLNDATTFSFGNGSNDYFWTSNFAGSMWTTNGLGFTTASFPSASNGIYYLTANAIDSWNIHQPQIGGSPSNTYLNGSLIILPYKGRLVCLNTIEGNLSGTTNTSFSNRARWCQLGTPYAPTGGGHPTAPPTPFSTDANSWRSDIPGKGGFVDADTSERIVSASIIKDTLIVAFQRSTWRLRYTGNEILPFIWERLNTQYGSESPYSVVAFDESALFFSRYGWIASTTNDVARIDLDIPDDSFSFEAVSVGLSGLNKVQGIRDFYRNFAYFTFIPIGQSTCTQIYGYNYIDRSWTIFNPQTGTSGSSTPLAINCFGYYRNTAGDFTWSVLNTPTDTWENYNTSDDTWSAFGTGENIDFPYTLGGDINGNTYLMFEFFQAPTTDNGTNFNFSIFTKRFNPYIEQGQKCRLGYVDLYCTTMPGGEITLNHYVDDQQSPVFTRTVEIFSRGVISISNIVPGSTTTITTVTDHGLTAGEFVTISDIVGSIGRSLNNLNLQVTSITDTKNFVVSYNTTGTSYSSAGFIYNADLVQGDSHYTRIYLGANAHMHQLQLTLNSNQIVDPVKGVAQFEMQGLVIWTRATGKIRG
jgi:hypothetical protein